MNSLLILCAVVSVAAAFIAGRSVYRLRGAQALPIRRARLRMLGLFFLCLVAPLLVLFRPTGEDTSLWLLLGALGVVAIVLLERGRPKGG